MILDLYASHDMSVFLKYAPIALSYTLVVSNTIVKNAKKRTIYIKFQ